MEPLRKAHELAMQNLEVMRQEFEKHPELKRDIEYNMMHYGVPFVAGSYGGRWREDMPKDVRDLLFEEMPYQLMEIRIYPEDRDGHHWGVEYNLLVWDEDKGFIKVVDFEQGKRGEVHGGNKGTG